MNFLCHHFHFPTHNDTLLRSDVKYALQMVEIN